MGVLCRVKDLDIVPLVVQFFLVMQLSKANLLIFALAYFSSSVFHCPTDKDPTQLKYLGTMYMFINSFEFLV